MLGRGDDHNIDERAGRRLSLSRCRDTILSTHGAALKFNLEAYCGLSSDDRDLIRRAASRTVRELPARQDLIREGDKPRGVNLVLDGWACRYKQLPNGRRQTVHFFIPGDLCDANVFILGEMDHSIASITPLRYAEIGPADFEALMARSAALTRALWLNELVNAAVAREWVANVGQRTAHERLAHLFCEMFLRLESLGLSEGNSCEWPLTQTDLADATGLTPVHVNRTLQDLRRRRLIETSARKLVVPDLQALKRVAMFNSSYLHLQPEQVPASR